MAEIIPIKVKGTTTHGDKTLVSLGQYVDGDVIGLAYGGTGASNSEDAMVNLYSQVDVGMLWKDNYTETLYTWSPFSLDVNNSSVFSFSNSTSIMNLYDPLSPSSNQCTFTIQGMTTAIDSTFPAGTINIKGGDSLNAQNAGSVLISAGTSADGENGHVDITGAYVTINNKIAIYDAEVAGLLTTDKINLGRSDNAIENAYIKNLYKSTTSMVTNLNADLLDGYHATSFALAGAYEPVVASGTTSQYYRGDKSWQTLDKAAVGLGSVENTALSTWAGTTNLVTAGALVASSLAIGTSAPATLLHVASSITTSPRGIMSSQHNTGTDGARIHGRKSRGTNATPLAVASGDLLSRYVASGYDGTNYLEMASIDFSVEGTVASTRVPTNIIFSTATNAAPSVLTERMRIDSAGKVGIGVTPAYQLHIKGGDLFVENNNGTYQFQVDKTNNVFYFGNNAGTNGLNIVSGTDVKFKSTNSNGTFGFSTKPNTRTGINDIYVANDGKVGINTGAPTSVLDVNGDIETISTSYFYMGDPTTDGTWRIGRSGNNLIMERRESGAYVNKFTVTA